MYLQSGLHPEPHWGSLQHSPRLHSWWVGACCSLLKNPSPPPFSAFGIKFRPFGPQEFPKKDIGFVSNQNCCKGFRFTQKVEKHWSRESSYVHWQFPVTQWTNDSASTLSVHCPVQRSLGGSYASLVPPAAASAVASRKIYGSSSNSVCPVCIIHTHMCEVNL